MPFQYSVSEIEEKEKKQNEILPEGIYKFTTVSCPEGMTRETESTQSVPKIVLTLHVIDENGGAWEHAIHITSANAYHVKKYWECVGKPEMFEKLSTQHDESLFIGNTGFIKTKHQENSYQGKITKRSIVHYFIPKKDQKELEEKYNTNKSSDSFIDDEIPF